MGEMPVEIHLAIRADPVVVSSLQSHFESSKRLLDGIIMTLQKKKKKKSPFPIKLISYFISESSGTQAVTEYKENGFINSGLTR